jgi:hypothetical protein
MKRERSKRAKQRSVAELSKKRKRQSFFSSPEKKQPLERGAF